MKSLIRCCRAAVIVASLALFANAGTATAQTPAACTSGNIRFVNNTSVVINIIAATSAGFIASGSLASGGGVANVAVPNPTNVGGLRSSSGTGYAWAVNPAPPPGWRLLSVSLNPGPVCVDLVFDPTTCTITAVNAGGPTPCTNP